MVFKRRTPRPWWRIVQEALWPRGGWRRAAVYVKHRLRRLPDSPRKICRGIMVGVFTTFTPFYALHFVVAALLARMVNGNIFAALLATFFGNPLTYVPIGVISLQTGYFLLGIDHSEGLAIEAKTGVSVNDGLVAKFTGAFGDLLWNVWATLTGAPRNWNDLILFWNDVFFPYMVGGLIPGVIAGVVAYYVALPLISAYQNRRRGRLKERFAALRRKVKRDGGDPRADD